MTHGNSYASGSGSTPAPSYDMPRRKRKWYRFGTGRDRTRGQEVWYSAYVSPRGQQPPTPNPYGPSFSSFTSPLDADQTYGPVGLLSNIHAAAYQGPSDSQRNAPVSFPVPMTAQYGSLHIPEGYIPPSVNPPVVPRDVVSPRTDPDYWKRPAHSHQHQRRPSQSHQRVPSRSHTPVVSVDAPVMPQPFSQPTTSTMTSFSSPPFRPFPPPPDFTRSKPPTPPPKLLDLPPYRERLDYLSNPTVAIRAEALEIIQDRGKRDIHRANEEWKRQDEERKKAIQEKKEERDRLISGRSTIRAPTMQTVTALVVDPTTSRGAPPPPAKEKKSFWKKLFKPGRSDQSGQMNGRVIIPISPQQVLPSLPGAVVRMPVPSQSQSSQTLHGHGYVPQPTPAPAVTPRSTHGGGAVTPGPSPFLRSTTPDVTPPPTAAFFSIPASVPG